MRKIVPFLRPAWPKPLGAVWALASISTCIPRSQHKATWADGPPRSYCQMGKFGSCGQAKAQSLFCALRFTLTPTIEIRARQNRWFSFPRWQIMGAPSDGVFCAPNSTGASCDPVIDANAKETP
jgi:hypothetical protein